MHWQRALLVLAAVMAACAIQVGCGGSGPEVVPVAGRLTHAGKPLPDMVIWFKPLDGRPSWGATDSDGRFRLNYSRGIDGARVGRHKVWVKYDPRPKDAAEEMAAMSGRNKASNAPANLDAILAKYGSETESPLEVSVAEAVRDLEIELD